MTKAKAGMGQRVTFGAEHRKPDGTLIHKEATRIPSESCQRRPKCIMRFALVLWWDTLRVAYCEKHRDAELPLHIRTGDVDDMNIIMEILRIYSYKILRRR